MSADDVQKPICSSCVAEDAGDCSGLLWGALVVLHDNPVMPEDYEPVPPFPEPCDCPCHSPGMAHLREPGTV